MRSLDLEHCRRVVFPFIHRNLTAHEPAPLYEKEQRGMSELGKVLAFMRDRQFYPTAADKAAYLMCSIAGSQYFSNGNKRLGVAALLFFLGLNQASMEILRRGEYCKLLVAVFPRARWEDNPRIPDAHSLFLYNLALVVGDRSRWNAQHFDALKRDVTAVFAHIYKIPEE